MRCSSNAQPQACAHAHSLDSFPLSLYTELLCPELAALIGLSHSLYAPVQPLRSAGSDGTCAALCSLHDSG
jgi:hypothetical protein